MKEEVVIINGEPRNVYNNGKDLEKGFTHWVLEKWDNPTGIRGEPQRARLQRSRSHTPFANVYIVLKH